MFESVAKCVEGPAKHQFEQEAVIAGVNNSSIIYLFFEGFVRIVINSVEQLCKSF